MLLRYTVLCFFVIFVNIALSDNSTDEYEYYDDPTTPAPVKIDNGKSKKNKTQSNVTGLLGEDVAYELQSHVKLFDPKRFLKLFHVITCDGYILDIFRMKSHDPSVKTTKKHPVLLMHGMWQSSDRFVEQGRENGIAFALQDLGYDVWLGNARGNKYCRIHLYLEPELYGEKFRFFNYSYEEIGLYDLAATVDYILKETESEKLHFVGHSQGGTAFLVLTTLLPKYNDKFVGAHLLAPIGYQNYFSNEKVKAIAGISKSLYEMLLQLGILEVFPYGQNSSAQHNTVEYCLGDIKYRDICTALEIDKNMNLDLTKFNNHDTQGGSIKQLIHYAQNLMSLRFARWDFGPGENKKHYNMFKPPEFDLKLITVRTVVHYAVNDEIVNAQDALDMVKDMSNGIARKVAKEEFTHRDFIDSPDVMECVIVKVIADMGNLDDGRDVEGSARKLSLSVLLYLMPVLVTLLNNIIR